MTVRLQKFSYVRETTEWRKLQVAVSHKPLVSQSLSRGVIFVLFFYLKLQAFLVFSVVRVFCKRGIGILPDDGCKGYPFGNFYFF